MLAGFTIEVEFRNKTWFDSAWHIERTIAFERENGLVNVVVDAPQGVANTIPAVWEVTGMKLLRALNNRLDKDDVPVRELIACLRILAPAEWGRR
jgi:uncharacterized protein YecE (DUF72 family)